MPVDVHHSGPEAHREPAKKSLEDREILGYNCGIYPRISRALRLIRGVGGTRGRLSELDPSWATDRVARHRARRGSTWVDHVRSEGHVTGTDVTWDFRGGGRTTWRGKSRGDGWDRYRFCTVFCLCVYQNSFKSLQIWWKYIAQISVHQFSLSSINFILNSTPQG